MSSSESARWEAELRALREELRELRAEQREIGKAVLELTNTFRQLAMHLGIASEPYARKSSSARSETDIPGFR